MSITEAEEIYMANELGVYHGSAGALAEAILVITAFHQENEEPQAEPTHVEGSGN